MKEFFNFDSAKISWFRCGGAISVYCIVDDLTELNTVCKKYQDKEIIIVGAGSNILVRDSGFNGVMIKLAGEFTKIAILEQHNNNVILKAGAAVWDKMITDFALKHQLIGCEFLNTIPGTIGGAIKTNSGCFGKEIKDILLSAELLIDGTLTTFNNADFHFSYRHGELPNNAIVLSVNLRLEKASPLELTRSSKQIEEMQQHRKQNQIRGATCGSTFINPTDKEGRQLSAWQLIDKVGLRGYQIGGARFSEQHCNFIINTGTASSGDIEKLILLAKQRVESTFGIILKTEIHII